MFGRPEPLFSAGDGNDPDEDEDGPDLEELRAMEEMENAMDHSDGGRGDTTLAANEKEFSVRDEPEADEEWEGLYD
jgi:hypothetical protein